MAVLALTVTIVGGALALRELTSDPIHETLLVDDGIVKSCAAGDVNDLLALFGPLLSLANSHVFVTVLEKSRSFAVAADAGLTAITEMLSKVDLFGRDLVLPGTCIILVGDADFSERLVVLTAVTSGGVLAQDDRTPSRLYFVDPTASGEDTEVGVLRTGQGAGLEVTDVAAWDATSNLSGGAATQFPVLYAITRDRLYRVNRTSGIAEQVATFGSHRVNALAFDAAGTLFASGLSGDLLRIDRRTGGISQVIPLAPSIQTSGDLLFLPDGRLLATARGGPGGRDRLVYVNPQTGTVQEIGDIGFDGVYGLSYFDGRVYALTVDDELLSVNLQTGRGTLLRELEFSANGASAPVRR